MGYQLRERIGTGGCGEVWRADAPGGLTKAVKIVYGFHEEDRAKRELKSLNLIKEARHPFLLSLERFDIVEGQLYIVTELADRSLRDRFDECQASGQEGIGRDELFGYLRDAADALDYLSKTLQLQHLDIKPENLLLIGDHAKVADFGLVKHVTAAGCSLVGGLTPNYAPPEVFDGRPTPQSDQYSLAVVYQEMLTGSLPFRGQTPAQLAKQHLHETPDLSSLSAVDIPAVKRALSKDPTTRFQDCREFVHALSTGSAPSGSATSCLNSSPEIAAPVSPARRTSETTKKKTTRFQFKRTQPTIHTLGPISDAVESAFRPTILVGLGGAANEIVGQLVGQLSEHHGTLGNLPAIRPLLVDSNRSDLASIANTLDLATDSTLEIPLKSSEDYLTDGGKHTSWLSRRWLYNIPRSLLTEGLRPLGRLALIEHENKFLELLKLHLDFATERSSIEQTAKSLGFTHASCTPRIIVVGSVCGGTSSGTFIDVGYLVRASLQTMQKESDEVLGLLLYWETRKKDAHDIGVANAIASLSELYGYVSRDETSVQFDGESGFEGPFTSTYLIDFGSCDVDSESFHDSRQRVTEYLNLSVADPCQCLLTESRTRDISGADPPTLRSFTFRASGNSGQTPQTKTSYDLGRRLAKRLLDRGIESEDSPVTNQLRAAIAQHQPNPNEFLDRAGELLATVLQADLADAPCRILELSQEVQDDANDALSKIDAVLKQILDNAAQLAEEPGGAAGAPKADPPGTNAARFVVELVDTLVDLPSVIQAREQLCQGVDATYQTLVSDVEELDRELKEFRTASQAAAGKRRGRERSRSSTDERSPEPSSYARLQLRAHTTKLAQLLVERARRELQAMEEQLATLGQKLAVVAETEFNNGTEEMAANELDLVELLNPVSGTQLNSLIGDFINHVRDDPRRRGVRLSAFMLDQDTKGIDSLEQFIREVADGYIQQRIASTDVAAVFQQRLAEDPQFQATVQQAVKKIEPSILECGGSKRLIIGIPASSSRETLVSSFEQQLGISPNVVVTEESGIVVLCESQDTTIANVLGRLIEERPACAAMANRLHTRIDVDWPDLSESL